MEPFLYISAGILLGAFLGWLWARSKASAALHAEKEVAQKKFSDLEKEYVEYKATTTLQLQTTAGNLENKSSEVVGLKEKLESNSHHRESLNNQVLTANAAFQAASQSLQEKNAEVIAIKEELKEVRKEYADNQQALATANARLQTQQEEIAALGKKLNSEFENIANKILETKTEKFTELNKTNLKSILEPLGENISEFKKQVQEVYSAESKERFSLGVQVKELRDLNQQISTDAKNLTRALKGEAKTRGRWGEMILETILDKSGLRKGEEFFMEYQLYDETGKPLRSEAKGTKMRPDAIVIYPDNRHVIIDSKVSLNDFIAMTESDDPDLQALHLAQHLQSIKRHIQDLNTKAYDDYDKTLDFVMMFVPSEAAFITAIQAEPDLWHVAYDKRILLISPTNLIAALKLIVDLWKREAQNKNAKDIAERGAKLYDKFVGFVDNLEQVGKHLDSAREKYQEAHKQLSTGNDNLVLQTTKLKSLGLKNKKNLPQHLVEQSQLFETEGIIEIEGVEIQDEQSN